MDPEIMAWAETSDADFNEGLEVMLRDEAELAEIWSEIREEVLQAHIAKHPCTRPCRWWDYDAPRRADQGTGGYWEGKLSEPRKRLGGTGTPRFEVLSVVPHFSLGLPDSWVSPFEVAYFNGRARDIHGKPIGTEYREGNFKGVAYDPEDPPLFESQAEYLQRHGLLTKEEERHLKRHPELLMPEKIEDFKADRFPLPVGGVRRQGGDGRHIER